MNRLAITRAFGDFEFKIVHIEGKEVRKTFLTAEPEIRMVEIDPFIDDFIVLASDGLFDKFSSSETISYIRTKMNNMPTME
jgi:serine/threonine protein phosphatase PrpC